MRRRPSRLWRPTGWKASDAGGYAIEHSLALPGMAEVKVHRSGASWTILLDDVPPQTEITISGCVLRETREDRYRALTDAKVAAEAWLRCYVAHGAKLMRWKAVA